LRWSSKFGRVPPRPNFGYGRIVADDDELAAFFRALPEERRREYEELAVRDRRFGEDVAAESRSLAPAPRGVS
jgi:uncharacterized protein YdbL (DUF1318 family)